VTFLHGDVVLLVSIGGVFCMVLLCQMCGGDILDDGMGQHFLLSPSLMNVDVIR